MKKMENKNRRSNSRYDCVIFNPSNIFLQIFPTVLLKERLESYSLIFNTLWDMNNQSSSY